MSNTTVGGVYEHIIQEVINAVRVDFEENGVDDGVLEELKKGWQHKLSQLNVAQFPWDPKPEPPPPAPPVQASAPPPAPAQQPQQQPPSNYAQATLSPQASAQPVSLPGGSHPNGNGVAIKPDPGMLKNDPVIKQEPGLANAQGPAGHSVYNNTANPGRGMAAQRAAQALESQYGPRAAASINAIHMGSQLNTAHQPQQGQRLGQAPQQINQQQMSQQQMNQQQMSQQQMNHQYRQGVMQQRPQPQQGPHPGTSNGLPAAQVDGSSDGFEGILMQRGPDGRPVEMGRVEIDSIIHAQIAARAKQMEGGGLMLPLKEATRHRGTASKKSGTGNPSQVDGPDDDFKDEDLDDDAINSDLDDPDDDKDDDEDDDDSMGHMMLCMYDKVQRVKNKWKCTLKDGVLTVNGREYVFHKATGEYEW
ncbi:transcription factor IIA, alpha/beta subunit [Lasiosphaeris hirsuta]|uniref:Transcription initiation factor IIA large subunit n=1 Tax=Lasiosphaeris hirsuta TaxID=260670 RepID=A0AA40BBX3_9PEZI|nr:transcription factor IIA, alpha/beta subunit [Lasiosphaeris hirsuta]